MDPVGLSIDSLSDLRTANPIAQVRSNEHPTSMKVNAHFHRLAIDAVDALTIVQHHLEGLAVNDNLVRLMTARALPHSHHPPFVVLEYVVPVSVIPWMISE